MKPTKSIIVVGAQRSGTSLLCEALKATGQAGVPEEYFLQLADVEWRREKSEDDFRAYVAHLLDVGTTPNGVFGANIMWNTHSGVWPVLQRLSEFSAATPGEVYDKVLPGVHYVWVRRRDHVRQAVSWVKAAQTGIYRTDYDNAREPLQEPEFDFKFIDSLRGLIVEGEAGWGGHFKSSGHPPAEVFYEDLVASFHDTISRVLEFCGLSVSGRHEGGALPVKKLADGINDEWVARYNEMRIDAP
jgi:LPS sulfotransferase NodH